MTVATLRVARHAPDTRADMSDSTTEPECLLFDLEPAARDPRGAERWEPPRSPDELAALAAPFPWYGGKAYYADWLIERFPRHRVYIEPFGGAANVLLRKSASPVEVFNDLDARVVGFFRVLRDRSGFEELVRRLHLTPYARAAFEEVLAEGDDGDAGDDDVARAAAFFVRCRQSIGGLGMSKLYPSHWAMSLRTRRAMAEPVSKYLSAIEGLEEVATRFRSVAVERLPAVELIRKYDPPRADDDVFFYCDPPYVPATRHGGRASTYGAEMSLEEHEGLLDAVLAVNAKVMLSGYAHPLYDRRLGAWRREELQVKTHLTNSGEARTEVIWCNY